MILLLWENLGRVAHLHWNFIQTTEGPRIIITIREFHGVEKVSVDELYRWKSASENKNIAIGHIIPDVLSNDL